MWNLTNIKNVQNVILVSLNFGDANPCLKLEKFLPLCGAEWMSELLEVCVNQKKKKKNFHRGIWRESMSWLSEFNLKIVSIQHFAH